jgi:hypothetical protein
VPNLDVWAAQLYRGYTFGEGSEDFLVQFEHISKKPLLMTEYGVDAMDDPCGRSSETPCYTNAKNPPVGFGENEKAQAEWVIICSLLFPVNIEAHLVVALYVKNIEYASVLGINGSFLRLGSR